MPVTQRKSLYERDVYEECLARIAKLGPDTQPGWGKMSVGQMLAHCAEIQEVANGGILRGTPWYLRLAAPLIRRMVVNDRPYPQGSRTHPQYLQTSEKDFETEKRRLLDALETFMATAGDSGVPHPLFGEMTEAERGWSNYKHLDHHLRQFGV